MNEQERLLNILKRSHEEIDDVCLVAALAPPEGGAISWKHAKAFYACFFMRASFISQSEPNVIIGGLSEGHYDLALIIVETLRKLPNVTIILDPQGDPSDP